MRPSRLARVPAQLLLLPVALFVGIIDPEPSAGGGKTKFYVDAGVGSVEGDIDPDEGVILCAEVVDETLRMCNSTSGCVNVFVDYGVMGVCPPID